MLFWLLICCPWLLGNPERAFGIKLTEDRNPVPIPGMTNATSYMHHTDGHEGEGVASMSMGSNGASSWIADFVAQSDAKQNGLRPKQCRTGIQWPESPTQVVKRSIQRAHRRALVHGVSWYAEGLSWPSSISGTSCLPHSSTEM